MRLYMVRHGETRANLEKFFYGAEDDLPLTDLGQEQAKSVRSILENVSFDKVFSSDYLRAIQTQRLALPGVEGIRTPLLREMDAGELGGKPYSAAYNKERFGDWTPSLDERAYSVVGGDSMEDVANRLRVFLKQLEGDPCNNVVAFVHNGVLGSMLRLVLGADKFTRKAVTSANCAVHVFEFDGKIWRLLAWNYGFSLE